MKLTTRRIRLRLAWLAAPVFLVLAAPTPATIAAGAALALAGTALRAWAAGTIVKNAALTQSSLLEYRAWAIDLVFAWHMTPAVSLAATGGVDVDAEYRAALADGVRTLLDAGTVARIGIELAWTF